MAGPPPISTRAIGSGSEHERRSCGQEAPLEAPFSLVRPRPAGGPDADRPRHDDCDGLGLGSGAHDSRRRDLGAAARGYADALALDERELLGSRIATATCLGNGHAFHPSPLARECPRSPRRTRVSPPGSP